jgi:hypothetical protein
MVTYFDDATVKTSSQYLRINCPVQSNEQYTTLTFPSEYDSHSVLDIQIEAILGKLTQAYAPWHPFYPEYGGDYTPAVKLVDVSGWRDTHTINLSDEQVSDSASTNSSPTPTPTVPEFSLVILPLFVAASMIIAIIARKKSLLKAAYK